jgi:ribosomal protein S18 acetylase RimI-like enzyme
MRGEFMDEEIIADKTVIRRAKETDIPVISKLLFQVHKVHSDVRPDLFKRGSRKYTDDELAVILKDDRTPVFAALIDGHVIGYAFCIYQQHINDNNLTDIKTLYIDDLCVDESMRGRHIGRQLYEYVVCYARQNGYYNVTLNVWADNKNALKFYESLDLKVQKIGMEKIL